MITRLYPNTLSDIMVSDSTRMRWLYGFIDNKWRTMARYRTYDLQSLPIERRRFEIRLLNVRHRHDRIIT